MFWGRTRLFFILFCLVTISAESSGQGFKFKNLTITTSTITTPTVTKGRWFPQCKSPDTVVVAPVFIEVSKAIAAYKNGNRSINRLRRAFSALYTFQEGCGLEGSSVIDEVRNDPNVLKIWKDCCRKRPKIFTFDQEHIKLSLAANTR